MGQQQQTSHFTGRVSRPRASSGPVPFLNPTTRYLTVQPEVPAGKGPGRIKPEESSDGAVPEAAEPQHHDAFHVWRSRDNRKGRHAVAVTEAYYKKAGADTPKATNTLRETLRGVGKMFLRYPVWDVSYDVATIFTWGSVVWVINGFFVWYPLANPSSEFPGEVSVGGGVTAFVGATIFEFGSVFLMLEAVNENTADCFGWALEDALESGKMVLHPKHEGCRHLHADQRSLLKSPTVEKAGEGHGDDGLKRKWSWWPTWYELRTHYVRDIGFLACLSQMIGATVFWISGFTGLPPIYNSLSVPAANGVYWLPQVIGGTGFIISSTLFMLETQSKWYMPALNMLGWHIGFWNLVGALGFTLCGTLGFAIDIEGVEYASTLATFIGSWAFLIGSVVQWYESLDKYPISIEKDESTASGD